MRIEIVGRNFEVTDEIGDHVRKQFARVARQVSDLARLDVILKEESNPSIVDRFTAEATLGLKGVTLHAEESDQQMHHAIKELSADMRRQVKRHRERRRKRSTTRRMVGRMRGREA